MLRDRYKQDVVSSLPFYRGFNILNITHIFCLQDIAHTAPYSGQEMISRFYLHLVAEFLQSISSVISRSVRKLFDFFYPSLNWRPLRDKLINTVDSGLLGCEALLSYEWFSTFRSKVVFFLSLWLISPSITNRHFVIFNVCRVSF
jgi:hypothetical protein